MCSSYGGVQMVQLYKREFCWDPCDENSHSSSDIGSKLLRRVKLHDNSHLERYYASCCGTPIGFSSAGMKSFPLFVVYRDLLSYTLNEFKPNRWRCSVSHVPVDQRLWLKDSTIPKTEDSEKESSSFMMVLMGRVIYGMMMGNNQPDPLTDVPSEVEVLHLNETKQ